MVTISTQFDCSQRELVVDIANMIYLHRGYKAPDDLMYFYNSQHPTEKEILRCAEDIYELFVGDSPNYEDEDE